MEPEFHDGQIAWVLQQESVANGEIGIFALNGEAYIKKLQNEKYQPAQISLLSSKSFLLHITPSVSTNSIHSFI